MAVLPAGNVDYTDKDFDSMLARLDSLIDQSFPDWTDRTKANFGNILKEMLAFILDAILYYQDRQAAEAFFLEATQRKNLIAQAKLLGFTPFGATAAEADLTFTLAAIPTNDVNIPAGTTILTREVTNPIRFRLLSPVIIPAGANPPVGLGTARNSAERQSLVASTGLPNQRVRLDATPLLDEFLTVQATNGIYDRVANFLGSRSTDRHFTLTVDQNDKGTLIFGNGQNGELPSGTIITDHEIGGGVAGNVEPDTIVRPQGAFQDVGGNPVSVTATNTSDAQGGQARQTNASIKERAPESLRVLTRTVAREDYSIAAVSNANVARALMLTSDQDLSVDENTGFLFILGTTGAPDNSPTLTTQATKDEVAAIFETRFEEGGLPKTVTFKLNVVDTVFLALNILAVVYLDEGVSEVSASSDINAALTEFFAVVDADGATNPNVDFGFNQLDSNGLPAGKISLSPLMTLVDTVPGVRKLGDAVTEFTINGLHQDIPILLREFPTLGTVTLINGDTGVELSTS